MEALYFFIGLFAIGFVFLKLLPDLIIWAVRKLTK